MRSKYGVNKEITGEYDKSLAIRCSNGTFVGEEDDGVIAFKGVPFAKQPVGGLRWKEPVDAPDSDEVYEAKYFGHTPIQSEWPSEVASYYPQGEDCLNLNIWVNRENREEKKPVMVFFHGGSYGWGGTSDPIYDGQNLVKQYSDIILVTVGYRVGIMGFIDLAPLDEMGEYEKSGNLGLLDQVCGLRWIKKNIKAFGGDPDNVTIWGESAGAGSVSLLPLIDGVGGLFHKVISESGSVALTYSTEECRRLTDAIIKEAKAETLDDLLNLTVEELKDIADKVGDYSNYPERDGIVLPKDPYAAYESGLKTPCDMLIGTNADEGRYWLNEMGLYGNKTTGHLAYKVGMPQLYKSDVARFSASDREKAEKFIQMQEMDRPWQYTEFYNELIFRIPALKQAEEVSKNGGNAYVYYWTYPSALDELHACHAVELAYVFRNPHITIYTGGDVNLELADKVQDMWTNFARTGNPSTDEYNWEPYTPSNRKTMVIGEEIHMVENLMEEKRELIEPLRKYWVNGTYVGTLESMGKNFMKFVIPVAIAVPTLLIGGFVRKLFKDLIH